MRKPVSSTPSWGAPVAVVAAIALLVAAFLLIRWYTTPLPLPPLTVDATQQVIPSITGSAFVTSDATFLLNPDDPFCWGIVNKVSSDQ